MTNHKRSALNEIDKANDLSDRISVDHYLASAQIHATLYLAEHQRIANIFEMAKQVYDGALTSTNNQGIVDILNEYLEGELDERA